MKLKFKLIALFLLISISATLIISASGIEPPLESEVNLHNYQIIETEYIDFHLPKLATHKWIGGDADDIYEVIVDNVSIQGNGDYVLKFTWEDERYGSEILQLHYEVQNSKLKATDIVPYSLSKYNKTCLDNFPAANDGNGLTKEEKHAAKDACKLAQDKSKLKFKNFDVEIGEIIGYETKLGFNESCGFSPDCRIEMSYPIYSWEKFNKIDLTGLPEDFTAIDDIGKTGCGDLVTQNERYYLTQNVDASSDASCFEIQNTGITFDLEGYAIYSASGNAIIGTGDYDTTGTTIEDGDVWEPNNFAIAGFDYPNWTIRDFYSDTGDGILLSGGNHTLTDITLLSIGGANAEGITLYGDNNYIKNARITGATGGSYNTGLHSYDNNLYVEGLIITGGATNVQLTSSATNNTFLNCSYNISKESVEAGSELIRKWYLDTQSNYSNGTAFEGANVSVYNSSNSLVNTQLADSSGRTIQISIIDYINSGGLRTFSTPHTINVTSSGYQTNSSSYNFTLLEDNLLSQASLSDITAPEVTSLLESPSDPQTYSFGQTYTFNATVTDSDTPLDTILLTFDGTNYSTTNNGDVYGVNIGELAAGEYSYTWYANDTNGNVNYTEGGTYTINKATPTASLTSDLGWAINETQEVVIGLSESNLGDGDVTYIVYRDDVSKSTGETWSPAYGSYVYKLNTTGGENYTSVASLDSETLVVSDIIVPEITTISPVNETISSDVNLNITYLATDTNLEECWWSNDSGVTNYTLTSCTNITDIVWNEGITNLIIYTNDSDNNQNSTDLTFTIDTITPIVNITSPIDTYNSSINTLNISYNVIDANTDSCWWSNDSGVTNYTLAGCINITDVIWNEGITNLTIYANDSIGFENSTNISFIIDITNPSLNITSPTQGQTFTAEGNVLLDIEARDTNLYKCYYNLTIGALSSTGIEIPNCDNISFLIGTDGTYSLDVWAVDIAGNVDNESITFYLEKEGGTGGGGGGGSSPEPIVIVVGDNETGWSMKTSSGGASYTLAVIKDSSRTKEVVFRNLGEEERTISLVCKEVSDNDIKFCQYVSIEHTNIVLPINKEVETVVEFTVKIPVNIESADYVFNIVAEDDLGRQVSLTNTVKVETGGFILKTGSKLFSSTLIFGLEIPYAIIFFISWILSGVVLGTTFFKRMKGGKALALFSGLGIALIVLFFI